MKSFAVCLFALILNGCKSDPAENVITPVPNVTGVYVLNEGMFGDPTGARLTLYDVRKDSAYQNVFESANSGASLGSVGDDMVIHNGKAYFVMSGSNNIVAMDMSSNQKLQEVRFPGSAVHDLLIDSTRNKLFVTRLYSSSVYVLNLSLLQVIDSIRVGANPQGMALIGDKLFVCNSGYGDDSTVTVVNANTNVVTATIKLTRGPSGAAIAPDGKLWVVCAGKTFGAPIVNGRVFIVDPATNAKVDSLAFTGDLYGAIVVSSDGYAYVIGSSAGFGGSIHRISTSSKSVNLNFITGTFYGIGYDDVAREIYASDAKSFTSDGEVKIYTNAGALRKTFPALKGPAVFGFKR
jgi:YVTN family beta-propeller protein